MREIQFGESFFEKETRCGFEISAMMKRAWAAQMKLLKIVMDICGAHGLTCFADWGTLLGAVRHHGFVPWDDDIDICLKREDYNKLIEVLPGELPKGVEVLGVHAVKEECRRLHSDIFQLRVGAVRDFWDINEYIRYFHGYPFPLVGIDIFPLDTVPRDEMAYQTQNKLLSVGFAIASNWEEMKREGSLETRLAQFEKFSGLPIPKDVSEESRRIQLWKIVDAVSGLYHEGEGDKITEYIFSYYMPERIFKKDWYKDAIKVPFENMEIAIPCGYEHVLKAMYGDYTQFKQGAAAHSYPYYRKMEDQMRCDLDKTGIALSLDELCDKVVSREITLQSI